MAPCLMDFFLGFVSRASATIGEFAARLSRLNQGRRPELDSLTMRERANLNGEEVPCSQQRIV